MALTRPEARAREKQELRRLLTDELVVDGIRVPHDLAIEAMLAFDEMPQASAENVMWAVIRHMKGDSGSLRAKIAVRAQRNGPIKIDWRRLRRLFDQTIPAGLGHTLAVESALAQVAEAVGIVATPDAYEARQHAG
jgi:hypothetical protein